MSGSRFQIPSSQQGAARLLECQPALPCSGAPGGSAWGCDSLGAASEPTELEHYYTRVFKVAPCPVTFQHPWATCPLAHEGERARRRDPSTHLGVACPAMKNSGKCDLGDACIYSHHAFEFWLHPTRFRTTLCSKGPGCTRSFCFFAHHPSQLRKAPCRPNQWPITCQPASTSPSSTLARATELAPATPWAAEVAGGARPAVDAAEQRVPCLLEGTQAATTASAAAAVWHHGGGSSSSGAMGQDGQLQLGTMPPQRLSSSSSSGVMWQDGQLQLGIMPEQRLSSSSSVGSYGGADSDMDLGCLPGPPSLPAVNSRSAFSGAGIGTSMCAQLAPLAAPAAPIMPQPQQALQAQLLAAVYGARGPSMTSGQLPPVPQMETHQADVAMGAGVQELALGRMSAAQAATFLGSLLPPSALLQLAHELNMQASGGFM